METFKDCFSTWAGSVCSLPYNHDGEHIEVDGEGIIARWSDVSSLVSALGIGTLTDYEAQSDCADELAVAVRNYIEVFYEGESEGPTQRARDDMLIALCNYERKNGVKI